MEFFFNLCFEGIESKYEVSYWTVHNSLNFAGNECDLNLYNKILVILGGHSSSSHTIPRCKIGTRPRQSELIPRTLALKLMGRVNRSSKQRAPVAPQNDDLSPQKVN